METRLIALKPHRYGRKRMEPGDEYNASEKDARLLIAMGKSRPAKTCAGKKEAPQQNITPAPAPRLKKPHVPRETTKVNEKVITGTDRPKRNYKRRDMQAE